MGVDRPRAFLDVSIAAEPAGRLVIELFVDKAPKTCENFLAICNGSHKGLTYALSAFHRVIDEFMIQGGDITAGDGTGGASIYGGEFDDEDLTWRPMDAAGLLCMANRGRNTNTSQFFITLEPCPHLDGKHTIFGHLVAGTELVSRIAKVEVDRNDRPKQPVMITRCGELQRRAKPKERRSSSRSVSRPPPRSVSRGRSRSMSVASSRRRSRSPSRRRTAHGRHRSRSRERDDFRSRRGVRSRSRSRSRGDRRHRNNHQDQAWHRQEDRRNERPRGGGDKYRPRHNNRIQEGRLGSDDAPPTSQTGIIFKGRGAMKYRERW